MSDDEAAQNLDMYWLLKACLTAPSRPDPAGPALVLGSTLGPEGALLVKYSGILDVC